MVMDLRSHFIHRIKGTTAREIITDGLTPVCVLQQLMLQEEEEKKVYAVFGKTSNQVYTKRRTSI